MMIVERLVYSACSRLTLLSGLILIVLHCAIIINSSLSLRGRASNFGNERGELCALFWDLLLLATILSMNFSSPPWHYNQPNLPPKLRSNLVVFDSLWF